MSLCCGLFEVFCPSGQDPLLGIICGLEFRRGECVLHVLDQVGHFLVLGIVWHEMVYHSSDVVQPWHQATISHRPSSSTQQGASALGKEGFDLLQFCCEGCFSLTGSSLLEAFGPGREKVEDAPRYALSFLISLWLQ